MFNSSEITLRYRIQKYKNINKVIIDLSGIDVEYGLLESESKRILKDFFKSKR